MKYPTMELWKELSMEMRPKVRYWLPAAAVEEADLRDEIRKLKERGFGGVEVVDFFLGDEALTGSSDGWATENWNHAIDVIADETRQLGMTMDVAVGPGWPIGTPSVKNAEDPAALCELTFGEMTVDGGSRYTGPIPERRTVRSEGTPVLIAAMAYLVQGNGKLSADSYLDLMPYIQEGKLEICFPGMKGEFWKVFAFYRQPACQKINGGHTYVIDHLSLAGTQAVEKYWKQIFERQEYPSMESIFCDSLEYSVAMDWTPGFPEEFEKRCGYSILRYLPVIGFANLYPVCELPGYQFTDTMLSDMINHDYGKVLTECYTENHLKQLERFAEQYGKTVRYQVAYNKAFEIEKSALAVGIPENEALGRPSIDSMKVMAGAVHLGRKKRYSFECAAEFGNTYGQSYEDLFWWVKRSLIAGMNAQVLHGASYSGNYNGELSENGHLPGVQWPGYEAFGKAVSNNWNRTLSVEDARGCLDAITRLNTVFRKTAKIDCAVYREDFTNDGLGDEFFLYPDGGALNRAGYSYEFVTVELLNLPEAKVINGRIDPKGAEYKCLIVPEMKTVKKRFLEEAEQMIQAGFPIVFQGNKPKVSTYLSDLLESGSREEGMDVWRKLLEKVWNSCSHVECLEELPEKLKKMGILAEVSLDGTMDLMTAVRQKDEQTKYVVLYGYNCVKYSPEEMNPDEMAVSALYRKGTTKGSYRRPGSQSRRKVNVKLCGEGTVHLCDYWTGKSYELDFISDGTGRMSGTVELEEDQMILLELQKQEETVKRPEMLQRNPIGNSEDDICKNEKELKELDAAGAIVVFDSLELEEFDPVSEQETSFLRSKWTKREKKILFTSLSEMKPWRNLDPVLEHFSGRGIYRGRIYLEKMDSQTTYLLELGEVVDTFQVCINGKKTEFPDQVLKRVDVTDLIHKGENSLEVIVTSNLYQKLFYPGINCMGIPLPYIPRDYGIWEEDGKEVRLLNLKKN